MIVNDGNKEVLLYILHIQSNYMYLRKNDLKGNNRVIFKVLKGVER